METTHIILFIGAPRHGGLGESLAISLTRITDGGLTEREAKTIGEWSRAKEEDGGRTNTFEVLPDR